MEPKSGNSRSKSLRNTGSITLVYTVFAPNSLPQVKKPMMSSTIFSTMVMAESGSGTKLESTMPRPEILLTDVWLGTRKK